MTPIRPPGPPDGFTWVPTYQGTAWISDESLVRLDRAFTLAKRALEQAASLHSPQPDPTCDCGGPKSIHENGVGACGGVGVVKCECTRFSEDSHSAMGNMAAEALAALNELLIPPAKEEPK